MSQARDKTQWLDYIESVHDQKMDFDLNRLRPLAQRLGVCHYECPVVTVAGTNGKGSVVSLLSELFSRHGLNVAFSISPHVLEVNERAVCGGRQISDNELIQSFQVVEQARGGLRLSYFEFLTLSLLLFFKQCQPDVLLLEVGLGGRLDVMNLVDADCAVVTSIDLDHTDLLGDTRELIAAEKAGIFRPGGLVVCGDPVPPKAIQSQAEMLGCDAYSVGDQFVLEKSNTAYVWTMHTARVEFSAACRMHPSNMATALAVFKLMSIPLNLSIDWSLSQLICEQTGPTGRQQWYLNQRQQRVMLDVAHNQAGVNYLQKTLLEKNRQPCQFVFGVLASKDHTAILSIMAKVPGQWHIAPLKNTCSVGVRQLAEVLSQHGVQSVSSYDSIKKAYNGACSLATPEECIIAFGSFYVVAEILSENMQNLMEVQP